MFFNFYLGLKNCIYALHGKVKPTDQTDQPVSFMYISFTSSFVFHIGCFIFMFIATEALVFPLFYREASDHVPHQQPVVLKTAPYLLPYWWHVYIILFKALYAAFAEYTPSTTIFTSSIACCMV